jgi:hypothetical protein
MTDLTAPRAGVEPRDATRAKTASGAEFPLWGAIALALAGAAALGWLRAQTVWTSGAFFDSDDAMRAVEVRDLLAGQSWFDMTAARLDPPTGMVSHWSRVVDAPLAALKHFFGLFLSPETAERATRLVFPFALLATLLRLAAWNATIFAGKGARLAAVWLTFLSGPMFLQFAPGRIDHHAPQIVLLMAALGCFLRGLDPAKARSMAVSAACMALSFAISLENAPFFVVMIAALPALFVLDGAKARAPLAWFAVGALVAFPLTLAATVAPARYFASACDAYSLVHFAAIIIGALGLLALAAAAQRLASPRGRAVAAVLAGGAVIATVVLVAPNCLGDPLGGLDPRLRDLWQSQVAESKPLFSLLAKSPNIVFAIALPVLLGLASALIGAWMQDGVARRRWIVVAGAIVAGFAAGLWQVRVFSSVTPIAMAALGVAALVLARRLGATLAPLARGGLIGAFGLIASPMGLALALPTPPDAASQGPDFTCLSPAALAPLAGLPPAWIVAPVDMGAHLLAHTPHSVFAAPYHRNNHGNRIAIDAFLSPPAEAERILRDAGAELVIWCASKKKPNVLVERAPNGLAGALARGEVPAWLERKAVNGPLRVFTLR